VAISSILLPNQSSFFYCQGSTIFFLPLQSSALIGGFFYGGGHENAECGTFSHKKSIEKIEQIFITGINSKALVTVTQR
jgi:hypothetical protein